MHADGPGLDSGSSCRSATQVVAQRMRSRAARCGVADMTRIVRKSRRRDAARSIVEHA
jgi:hypothetical protein